MTTEKHEVSPENARKFLDWIANRGGIAIWRSVNLGNPGASWSTPVNDWEGNPAPKPTWEADSTPERIITNAQDVDVVTRKEVNRFRVGVRRGSGLSIEVTEAGTRKIRAALDKAGIGASYHFDYETQEAVITMPGLVVSLAEWEDAR